MNISAKDVMSLREMTSAPMMDCKSALTESNGDIEAAKEWLRKKGLQAADKKAGRDANEGLIGVYVAENVAYLAEVNCETDFVSRNENFHDVVQEVLQRQYQGTTLSDEELAAYVGTIGEKLVLGKTAQVDHPDDGAGIFYVHNGVNDTMGSLVVAMTYKGGDEAKAKQVAMHIAASAPQALDTDSLDQEWIAKETKFLTDQALESGKPAEIVEKMIAGRMQKVLREVTLLDQPFVVDPDTTVGKFLKENDMEVVEFVRLKVGE